MQVGEKEFVDQPSHLLERLKRIPVEEVRARQAALALHRADVTYDDTESRVCRKDLYPSVPPAPAT